MAVSRGSFRLRRSPTSHLCSESTFPCAFLRRDSSRASNGRTFLPVHRGLPFRRPREYRKTVKTHTLFDQKNLPLRSPRDVTLQTTATCRRPIDSLDRVPTLSTLPEDSPALNSSNSLTYPDSSEKRPAVMSTVTCEDSLFKRLLHFYMSSSHFPICTLVAYHCSFPGMQSTRSYNLLLRLAVQHSEFSIAHNLLRLMRTSRITEDLTTWKLCVRLLVRQGRWPDAYNLVFDLPKDPPRAPFTSGCVPVTVWVELLGTTTVSQPTTNTQPQDPGMHNLTRYFHLMRQLPKLGISTEDTPPPQVVYASVAALIRMEQREAARQVTVHFLGVYPEHLGRRLVHLHLAADPGRRTNMTFFRALRDLKAFCAVCPKIIPNSTTLSLLLDHLEGVEKCGELGNKLVGWFHRQWGNTVVTPSVERRSLALAVKQKRVDLIRLPVDSCEDNSEDSEHVESEV